MAQQNDDPPNAGPQKLTQLRVEKLRKEEEEEQWISGEELYTEGSSEEDLADPRVRRRTAEGHGGKLPPRRRGHKCTSPRNHKKRLDPAEPSEASGGACAGNSLLPEVTVTSQLSDSETQPDRSVSPAVDSEEEVEISWRPKRGSIKLPELSTEGRLRSLTDNSYPNFFESSSASVLPARKALDKIKEMDALLFVVEAKRKESLAKTEQSQMKIRQILKELCEGSPTSGQCKFLARNVKKFMKLSSSTVNTEDNKETHKEKGKGPSFAVKMKGTRRSCASTKSSAAKKKRKTAKRKFLLRNVQLAADGKGTLAITSEEKSRLTRLLRGKHPPPEEKFVRLDPCAVQLLLEIDSKLKEFGETQYEIQKGDEHLEDCTVKLEEIELTLSRLNEATTEVVAPLEEGELRTLLETCRHPGPRPASGCPTPTPSECSSGASVWPNTGTLRNTPTETPPEIDGRPSPRVTPEAPDSYGELVAEARRLMPFFKFRY